MGTKFIRTNLNLGSINTTKLMLVGTNETIYTIESGNVAFEVTNLGPQSVYYGNSGVALNSGGLITGNGSKFFDSVVGNFTMRFITLSGSSNLVAQEYAGN